MESEQNTAEQEEEYVQEIPLFLTSCFTLWLDKFDNEDLASRIIEFSKKNPGRKLSNQGGWQSDDVIKSKIYEYIPDLKELVSLSEYIIKPVLERHDLPYNGIIDAWINVNNHKDYNSVHDHPFTAMSMVYFISCPEKSGRLVFERPDNFERFARIPDDVSTPNSFTHFNLQPIEGLFVAFPGYLRHRVEENLSQQPRISIAMNFT